MLPLEELLRHKGIVLDTNALILIAVGWGRPSHLSSHKRTRKFTPLQFSFAAEVALHYLNKRSLWATPHVLSQVSDLLESKDLAIWNVLKAQMAQLQEWHSFASTLVAQPAFERLGLADAAVLTLLREKNLALLTADLDLYLTASHSQISAYNLTYHQ